MSVPITPLRLIAVDIDGTLLDSKAAVSEQNVRALNNARARAIHVVLATARRPALTTPIVAMLGFQPYVISSHGALTRTPENVVADKHFLHSAIVKTLLEEMPDFADNVILVFDRPGAEALVTQSYEPLLTFQSWLETERELVRQVSPLAAALTEDPVHIMFYGTRQRMLSARHELSRTTVAADIFTCCTQYPGNFSTVEILRKGCNKGAALARLCARLGVGRSEVMAIGDNLNDREMLAFAEHAFVMENAPESMKQHGWKLTLSSRDHGVAHAIASMLCAGGATE